MSFGWGVGDILAISGLAIKVYTAYKDAPEEYRHISEEVVALQILIDQVAQHFKSATMSSSDRLDGQNTLKGCQSVLKDLNTLIEKYKSLASSNKGLVFKRIKLGNEDISAIRIRLISNTVLLSGFVRRFVFPVFPFRVQQFYKYLYFYHSCEYLEIQAQLTAVLGLHRTNSRISITSIASFAENANTRKAYKQFCRNLHKIGVTEDMIRQKEAEILDILRSQSSIATSGGNTGEQSQSLGAGIGGSNIGDQGQSLGAGNSNAKSSLHTYTH